MLAVIAGCNASPQQPRLLAASRAPVTPQSWAIPLWVVDGQNTSGCASDNNNCTQATCGGSGVGPCLTRNEIIARWGTESPVIAQNTNVQWLSGPSANSDAYRILVRPINGATYSETGALTQIATFTLGTVTAKNRATPQLLQSTGFSAAGIAVNQLVVNTTRASSRAWIRTLVGGTVTLTQPVSNPGSPVGLYTPTEIDTWTTGDTVIVYSVPTVNIRAVSPVGGTDIVSSAGYTWVQDLHWRDPGGVGSSYAPINCSQSSYCQIVENVVEQIAAPNVAFMTDDVGLGGAISINSVLLAGRSGFAVSYSGGTFLDQDIVLENGYESSASTFIGLAYVASGAFVYTVSGGAVTMGATYGTTYAIWGPGSAQAKQGGGFFNVGGGLWANSLLVTGTVQVDSATTATRYSAGTFTDSTSVTAANLDTYGALFSPKTGSRFATSAP